MPTINVRTFFPLAPVGVLVLGLGCLSPLAHAGLTINSVVGGVPSGAASYVNFDDLPLGSAGGSSAGIAVSFTGTGRTVQGSLAGQYAAPYLSNHNGAQFGNADGLDATPYLSTGIGTVIMRLPGAEKYFGLLWGSVDTYNTLEFFDANDVSLGTITGSQVAAVANGNQGASGTYYVNIDSTTAFNKVVARSSSYAFEFDNVAFNVTELSVPEPESAALLAMGLGGLCFARRRRAA
ncbi:MAG: PEP-CTERM sorting domain-containing protein [Candidatus Accumulibacter sp.]|uniref:Npun_F0296 family exosortase-dependent surface protein n=1 Tax=Accumulibacter sp. TaxID=2053492 RepID=UPI0025DDECBA|nr:PEP-CTERM sorting domain-containing protein [Accumulibacter sp.]MCM8598610.1 PEP-CTERM sorting domain-containing protein [Accumulibacter sp.]MCM8663226.1 PEP-CTERM sorting domain-containing protein [Accumulibacter sp.]